MAMAVCLQFPGGGEGGLLSNKPCWPGPSWQCFLPGWQSLCSLSSFIQSCQQHMMERETKLSKEGAEEEVGAEGMGRNVEKERKRKRRMKGKRGRALMGRDEKERKRDSGEVFKNPIWLFFYWFTGFPIGLSENSWKCYEIRKIAGNNRMVWKRYDVTLFWLFKIC